MACKDVSKCTEEYEKLAEQIKTICTDRACTSETILKTLETKLIKVNEATLLTAISQIRGMMVLDKKHTYDIGDTITYQKGRIFRSEEIGNLLVEISYKKFYLYNLERCEDSAFCQYIYSNIEFEVHKRETIVWSHDLESALSYLKIPKENWGSFVFIYESDNKVYYLRYYPAYHGAYSECAGRLINRFPSK